MSLASVWRVRSGVRMRTAVDVAIAVVLASCDRSPATVPRDPPPSPQVIRVAVIGGMVETGFWPALAERFTRETGHHVELAASGPKPQVLAAFGKGGVDLVTTHACDAIVNVVADGIGVDPQPWARNDLVLVGPAGDPAGIHGQSDAVAALRTIVAGHHELIVHASNGADEVLHDLLEDAHLELDPATTIYFSGDQHGVLARAATENAYTLVGRIPYLSKKLDPHGTVIMVQGDPRLRRPYLVVVAAGPAGDIRLRAAHQLADWLRSPATQAWIDQFGRGRWDPEPVFYPVILPASTSTSAPM